MSQKTDANHLLPPERFTGELAVDGQRIPVQLTAKAGSSGRLQLAVDPISTANSSVAVGTLIRSFSRPGNAIDEFAMECESSDSRRLTSESAYLAGYNRNSEALHIQLRTREASVTMTATEIRPRPALRFSLLGFACFPLVQVPSAIGSVIVEGATRAVATDEITGSIAAEAADDCPSATWRPCAEHMLKHLRSVLAFSRGVNSPEFSRRLRFSFSAAVRTRRVTASRSSHAFASGCRTFRYSRTHPAWLRLGSRKSCAVSVRA